MKFYVDYFGCRSNQAELQEWIIALEHSGYELTASVREADFAILNTCSVTARAERDVLHYIGRTYRQNNLKWFIAGCTVTQAKEALAGRYKNYFFFDNQQKPQLIEKIKEVFPVHHNVIYHSSFKSRLFLKVQDGCNFRCSFCIVPQLRGRSRSLSRAEAVQKARRFAALGYREIVLTGINLSSFGFDRFPRQTLLDLIRDIHAIPEIEIVRLSSLDPRFLRYDFIQELSGLDKIADSFHFPLQSGCDAVLQAMKRGGKTLENQKILGQMRRFFPDANLGADIIVGFPAEGDKEFRKTVAFIQDSPLNYLHIFPFSSRPGTRAALLEPVAEETLRRRLQELKELNLKLKLDYRENFLGRALEGILIEETPAYALLITRNFLNVRLPPLKGLRRKKLRVHIERVINENLCEGRVAS